MAVPNILVLFLSFIVQYLYSMIKWILRKWTGLCELQRICKKYPEGADRTVKIEKCLAQSKIRNLQTLANQLTLSVDECIHEILRAKNIAAEVHSDFVSALRQSFGKMASYKLLHQEVEILRKTPVVCGNPPQDAMLMEIWSLMIPQETLSSRTSKQWQQVGFQGDDPATDFRGMGALALHQLLYICQEHTDWARSSLLHCHHPKHECSWALVGIHMTALLYDFLRYGTLKKQFYGTSEANMKTFHALCYSLFKRFDEFWCRQERDIMSFNIYKDEFIREVTVIVEKGQL